MASDIKIVDQHIKRICIIGNACTGKTRLARYLQQAKNLPLHHIDSIQFLSGMQLRNPDETRIELIRISENEKWIIDGFGPLNIIEDRFQKADLIIFIRLSLFINYWWMIKRQFKSLFIMRSELPKGCFEATPAQTYKLIKTIYNVHFGMWPQLDRIFQRKIYKEKILFLRSSQELIKLCKKLKIQSQIGS